jgi:hypothetical protein
MSIFIFVALLRITSSLAAAGPSASDPAWRALLHFPSTAGGQSSAEPESAFFLSKDGYRNPEAELGATLRYFDEHPQEAPCRFPARALYLGRTVISKESEVCERWYKWRSAIRAKGAELVFASAFISSPSSMYGHTLLKFLRSGETEGNDLLDYTLNYGADTGQSGGLAYVWNGLTGGFSGSYTTAPFYIKVREYNFVENRDFWLYPLTLSQKELELLVAHAWELRDVKFPYYFLHRNCAFYMLELLEVLRPGADFASHFPLWTVPADTIRLLQAEGLAGVPRYRVSRYRRLRSMRDALSENEKALAERIAEGGSTEAPLSSDASKVLDAAYELWRYRFEGKTPTSPETEAKILAARAKISDPPQEIEIKGTPPELGHSTSRVYGAFGLDRLHEFAEVGYRGKLHDLLASAEGYEEYSELSMGDLRARIEDGKIYLERADILRLRSLAPRETWIPRLAWSFRTGFERAKEFDCSAWGCSAAEIEGGAGFSTKLGPLLGFALLGGGFEAGKPFDRGYRLGIGPEGGMFTPLWSGARALLEGTWRLRVLGSQVSRRGAALGVAQTFSRNFEARLTTEVTYGYREGVAQMTFYF